mgnify:CR=1 FL=1
MTRGTSLFCCEDSGDSNHGSEVHMRYLYHVRKSKMDYCAFKGLSRWRSNRVRNDRVS